MNNEEAQNVLDELQNVRLEMLNGEAKRLFEAIMKIADQRDLAWKVQYAMAEFISERDIDEEFCPFCKHRNEECTMDDCLEQILKYFKKKVEKGNNNG